jgi:hypothetical protein
MPHFQQNFKFSLTFSQFELLKRQCSSKKNIKMCEKRKFLRIFSHIIPPPPQLGAILNLDPDLGPATQTNTDPFRICIRNPSYSIMVSLLYSTSHHAYSRLSKIVSAVNTCPVIT